MKDIPVFTTEHGAASLILREIPYRQIAYITLHDTLEPGLLLDECVGFCKACGAEKIVAKGHAYLESFPFDAAILQMACSRSAIGQTDALAIAVTPDTLSAWRKIYNEKMATVPHASYMTESDGKELLAKADGYFIYRGDRLLGIGKASDGIIHTLAAVTPGAGEAVTKALATILTEDTVQLTVANTNEKALQLYKRLGFQETATISAWYRVGSEVT